jgi:NhaP-type Na+/H+ or K+/H+ antiporter
VFAVIVMGADLPHGQTITAVVAWTVILSLLAHGMTANPWARAYGARARRAA